MISVTAQRYGDVTRGIANFCPLAVQASRIRQLALPGWHNVRGKLGAFAILSFETTIDNKFGLIKVIGQGAFGDVYEAWQIELCRRVALKILRSASPDAENTERLLREASILCKIRHMNIVNFYSAGTWQGRPYIAVEFLDGINLRDYCEKNVLDTRQLYSIFEQVCKGLECAHSYGVVHRDLKPENIFLVPSPDDAAYTAKILDFGLAKFYTTSDQQGLTALGTTVGTVAYMSPEQCKALPTDGRSDIYALGCIIYEMVTGEVVFEGQTPADAMMKHVEQAPPQIPEDPRLSINGQRFMHKLNAIVLKCLNKRPEHRYQTAVELMDDLHALKEEISQEDRINQSSLGSSPSPESVRPPSGSALAGLRVTRFISIIAVIVLLSLVPVFYLISQSFAPIVKPLMCLPPSDLRTGMLRAAYTLMLQVRSYDKPKSEVAMASLNRELENASRLDDQKLWLSSAAKLVQIYKSEDRDVEAHRMWLLLRSKCTQLMQVNHVDPYLNELAEQYEDAIVLNDYLAAKEYSRLLFASYLEQHNLQQARKWFELRCDASELLGTHQRPWPNDESSEAWSDCAHLVHQLCEQREFEEAASVALRLSRLFAEIGGLYSIVQAEEAASALSLVSFSSAPEPVFSKCVVELDNSLRLLISATHEKNPRLRLMFTYEINLLQNRQRADAMALLERANALCWLGAKAIRPDDLILRKMEWWTGAYFGAKSWQQGPYAEYMRRQCAKAGPRGVAALWVLTYMQLRDGKGREALKSIEEAESRLTADPSAYRDYDRNLTYIALAQCQLVTKEPAKALVSVNKINYSGLYLNERLLYLTLKATALKGVGRESQALDVILRTLDMSDPQLYVPSFYFDVFLDLLKAPNFSKERANMTALQKSLKSQGRVYAFDLIQPIEPLLL
jgi:serine/threonine protein kinase